MATDTSNFNFQGIGIVGATSIHGCTVLGNVNYNPLAVVDDGSCIALVLGCTDPLACNFDDDAGANFDDGSCEYCSCQNNPGCDDPLACNYDPLASCNDGSCVGQSGCIDPLYDSFDSANTCDCNGVVNGNDNTCCVGLLGCMDDTASNYNSLATVNDPNNPCISCIYGCTDSDDFNYDASATCDDGSCIASVYGCTDSTANNDDDSANIDDGSCTYTVYGCTDDTASNWYGSVPANTTLIDDGLCEYLGCTDPLACNYDSAANVDDGSCILPAGCDDPLFLEYDPLVTYCPDNTNDCQNLIVNGCMECGTIWEGQNSGQFCNGVSAASSLGATNYNPLANVNSGCTYPTLGCMDPTACNYNSAATVSDGSCTYPAAVNENCDGNCLPGFIAVDTVCVEIVTGCTDSTMFNYNVLANIDDGSCIAVVLGCLDSAFGNFNDLANTDDGSCIDCANANLSVDIIVTQNTGSGGEATPANGSAAITPSANADDTAYTYTFEDSAGGASFTISTSGTTTTVSDLNEGDYTVNITTNNGCTFTSSFTIENNINTTVGCTVLGNVNYNPLAVVDDGTCEYGGCMNSAACFYDPLATVDDGSCLGVGDILPAGYGAGSTSIIFHVDNTHTQLLQCRGFVAAPSDQSPNITGQFGGHYWGCNGTTTGANNTGITTINPAHGGTTGGGFENTATIVGTPCGGWSTTDDQYSAALITQMGGSGWWLPSKDELELMEALSGNDGGIGDYSNTNVGFNITSYWSSTEATSSSAYENNLGSTSGSYSGYTSNKNGFSFVRKIKAFHIDH